MAQYWSEYPLSEVDGQVPSALPVGRYVSVISNGHGALTAVGCGAKQVLQDTASGIRAPARTGYSR